MARLLLGKPLADAIAGPLRERTARLGAAGRAPTLALVALRPDSSSVFYAERLRRAGSALGVRVAMHEASGERALHEAIARANGDPSTHGVTVLAPLPAEIDAAAAMERIDPAKDVEGLHPYNAGRLAMGRPTYVPPTAEAILLLLRESGVRLEGARAVVIGRSPVVGRPAALLLMGENATVTLAHRGTHGLGSLTQAAEILVVAVGRAHMVTADMVGRDAVVVDAGINTTPDGIVGDVDFAAVSAVARAITPVPGGVGSLTTTLLLRNVVRAAEAAV